MIGLLAVRHSMQQWSRFLSACIFVAGLLLKAGAPLRAVMLGIAFAGIISWMDRRRQPTGQLANRQVRDRVGRAAPRRR